MYFSLYSVFKTKSFNWGNKMCSLFIILSHEIREKPWLINQQTVLKSVSTKHKYAQFLNFDWTFFPPRLPPKIIPGVEQKRRLPGGCNSPGNNLGFILPCPTAIPLCTPFPSGKKKADSISRTVPYIETHPQEDMVAGYFVCFFFQIISLLRNIITL